MSRTISTPRYSPMPCTVPMIGCLSCSACNLAFRCAPTRAAFCCSSLVAQHVEDRDADRARQRAAAGGREEVALTGKLVGDLPAGDHRAERRAVAGGLRDRHDVGDDVLLLKAPEPVAEPAVRDLDLVGNRQTAAGAHGRVQPLQVVVGQRHAAGIAVHRLRDERGGRPAVRDQAFDLGHRFVRVSAGIERRGTYRGSCWATPLCAPNPAGWQARWGCRPSTWTRRRWRTSTRDTPRARRPRRAGRWPPSPAAAPNRLPPSRS